MKKILLIAIVALLSFNNAQAQLPDGSVAPDFTLTDINGVTHNLYTYLDNGYTVFIDLYAVWCGPCWNYKLTGTLDDLYEQHGPAGYPNVNANTTDDVMVIAIEADANALSCMYGTGCNTAGDWITGNPFPQICTDGTVNTNQVAQDYGLAYYPTIYMICPDRLTTEVGQSTTPYSSVSNCPAAASNNDDARTFGYVGETVTCEGDLVPEIMIQNYGLTNLTSLSIEVKVNGTSQSVTPWTGNLSTYATDNVTLPALIGLANNDAVTIDVSLPNGVVDQDPSNNPTISFNITLATQNTHTNVTVNITTDAYGSETTWDLKNSSGITIASGGPYNDLSAAGTTPQTPVTTTLSAQECHTFTIHDSYGDGINAGYGAGSFTVVDANMVILVSGGVFTDEDKGAFKTGNASTPSWDCDGQGNCSDPGTGQGIYSTYNACATACVTTAINEEISNLSVYPNPVKDVLTIVGDYTSVAIYDVFGKLVLTTDAQKTIDVSTLNNGVYFVNIHNNKAITVKKITVAK